MVIDSQTDDLVPQTEKDQVVNINPGQIEGEADNVENVTLATDRTLFAHSRNNGSRSCSNSEIVDDAMKEIVLTHLTEEPRILEDVVNTWKVENWRQLNKKEHGPIFQAGGYPWSVYDFAPYSNQSGSV